MTLFAGFLALFCGFGFTNAFGVFEEYYHSTFLPDRTPSDVSWIGALQIFFIYIANIISGPALDRFGPKPLMASFAALFALGCMMTSLCSTYWQLLLAQGFLTGSALSFGFAPMMSCAMQWFGARRGPIAVAVVVSGSSFGGVLWPIIVRSLLNNLGFGWTWRTIGFTGLGLLIASTFMAHKPPVEEQTGMGFGEGSISPLDDSMDKSTQDGKDAPHLASNAESSRRPFFYPEMLKSTQWLLFLFGFAFVDMGLFFVFFYLPSIGRSLGMSVSLTSYSLSILNAASIFGRLILPLPAPYFGVYNMMVICAFMTSAVIFSTIAVASSASVLVVGGLYGFVSGGVISLMSPCISYVTPDKSRIGASTGQFAGLIAVPAMMGPPIAGWIVGTTAGYTGGAAFAGTSMALGAILILTCRVSMDGRLRASI